ncbi:MAG: glycosyltransferase family 4 protein [Cyclobacteriaceae bacterium]
MINIVERLNPEMFESTICIKKSGGNIEQELRQKEYKILIANFESGAGNFFIKLFHIIKRGIHFRKYGFDLWHSFNWSSDFTEPVLARIAGAKFLYTKKNMNWDRRAWIIKSFLSTHIVARNQSMMDRFFSPHRYWNKVTYIPGGVNVDIFNKSTSVGFYRNKYLIHEDTFVVTCVAQVVPIKGQHLLLDAIRQIPDTVVFIAGAERNSEYLAHLSVFIDNHDLSERVFFLGQVRDVAGLLNETSAFVLPTTRLMGHEEGCPVALLEAMASGVPCIASNVAGNIDLIKHSINGYLFEADEAPDLMNAILMMKNNYSLAKELGRQAAKDVKAFYTLDIEAKRFEEVYKKVIAA